MESHLGNTKKKPKKIEDMTKEQIRQAIVKKRECNAKAQKIVESLLERDVSEQYFLECLPEINQSHLEDVIEERSIIHFCGYPICQKSISQSEMPKQKYKISTKTNKVYDITARKNFCSNPCYKAAMYVKKQMLTSPLWFREYEDIPKFSLITLDTVGSLGQEVNLSIVEKIDIQAESQTAFRSIHDFSSASLQDLSDSYTNNEVTDSISHETNKETENSSNTEKSNKADIQLKESPISEATCTNTAPNKIGTIPTKTVTTPTKTEINLRETEAKTDKERKVKSSPNPLNIVGEIIAKPEQKVDPILTNIPETLSKQPDKYKPKTPQKKQPSITVITVEVEKCLAAWFTLDTMLLLFGEEKVKEMVADKGECIKDYLNNFAKSISYSANSYDQYQTLCRKLNLLDLEDRKFDSQTLQRETKPLPDYSIIKEESKKMQLKVKAFLSGETEIPDPSSIKEADKTEVSEVGLTQLPLVDKNAQNALRRRIVCEHLNKVLPDLLRSLGLLTLSISSDVHLLVNTFKLRADNIMFKPIQWTLIAIIIIKLLSLRDQRLEYLLKQQMAYQHMQLLLLSYKQDGDYLDRLISWLTDIDRLLDTNDTQLTIEC